MKKITLTFIVVGILGLVLISFIVGRSKLAPGLPSYTYSNEKTDSSINIANVIAGIDDSVGEIPVRLLVPKLSINTIVEQVGVTDAGNMAVPKSFANVGWYKLGVRPGQTGSAVIAGHLDNAKGKALVFYNLKKLVKGDLVIIKDEHNNNIEFKVTKKLIVDYDKAPLSEIFGREDTARLNLITCDGPWLRDKKTYSKRLIIFTEKI